jgi:hypothetical protein
MPPARGELLAAVESFLARAGRPVLIEPGEPELALAPGHYTVDEVGNSLRIHAWTETRSYSRRIVAVMETRPGRIDFSIARLGQTNGRLSLVDAAHGRNDAIRRRSHREAFCECFRMALARQYPHWKLVDLSTAPDLENSLSPSYPRAFLKHGHEGIAAIAAPSEMAGAEAVLTFGLIWLDYLRRREKNAAIRGLALFVPEAKARSTALRLRLLDPQKITPHLFLTRLEGGEEQVDPKDWGNLVTRLDAPHQRNISSYGQPEAELEQAVIRNIPALDAALDGRPVYQQAPALAAGERGVIDLLAVEFSGRLAVVELKASSDIHLPLQALDYWTRVNFHLQNGDFERLGYFPGRMLLRAAPRLLLVSPALSFHPANETVLRFFCPEVPVTRLGIGDNWRERLAVLMRRESRELAAGAGR